MVGWNLWEYFESPLKIERLCIKPNAKENAPIIHLQLNSQWNWDWLISYSPRPIVFLVTRYEVSRYRSGESAETVKTIPLDHVSSIEAKTSSWSVGLLSVVVMLWLSSLLLTIIQVKVTFMAFFGVLILIYLFISGNPIFRLILCSTTGETIILNIRAVDVRPLWHMFHLLRELTVISDIVSPVKELDWNGTTRITRETLFLSAPQPEAPPDPGPAGKFPLFSAEQQVLSPGQTPEDEETAARYDFIAAINLYKQGRYQEAIGLWQEIVRRYPNTTAAQAASRTLEQFRRA